MPMCVALDVWRNVLCIYYDLCDFVEDYQNNLSCCKQTSKCIECPNETETGVSVKRIIRQITRESTDVCSD